MKTFTITTLLIACFSLVSYSQNNTDKKQKPQEVYQVGSAKVIVWENIKADWTTWQSFQVEKKYQTKEGEWKTTNSFSYNELKDLRLALDKAISQESLEDRRK